MIIDERWALCQRLRAVIFKFRYINYYKPIEIYYTRDWGQFWPEVLLLIYSTVSPSFPCVTIKLMLVQEFHVLLVTHRGLLQTD